MIEPVGAIFAVNSLPSSAMAAEPVVEPREPQPAVVDADPVLCGHCGRTASNGLVCIGMCVADSGY